MVLLAAYNGAEFLSEQIQSIQGQTISNWTLLVRDDGSEDNTSDVLEKLAAKDKRIRCIHDTCGCLGAARNFGELMRVALVEGADLIFFSDQDDVWVPDKIVRQLQCLQEMERQYGLSVPLLCYSDLEVVDENLSQVHPSLMRYQGQRHESRDPIGVLLTQNLITGCTVLINRPLLELAVPIPEEAIMHDWWLALCAAACGRIGYIDQPIVRYRQHATNHLGAVRVTRIANLLSADSRKRLLRGQHYMLGAIRQAGLLSERITARKLGCSGDVHALLDSFASCAGQGRVHRLLTVYRLRLRRQGVLRKLSLFLRLLIMRPRTT